MESTYLDYTPEEEAAIDAFARLVDAYKRGDKEGTMEKLEEAKQHAAMCDQQARRRAELLLKRRAEQQAAFERTREYLRQRIGYSRL